MVLRLTTCMSVTNLPENRPNAKRFLYPGPRAGTELSRLEGFDGGRRLRFGFHGAAPMPAKAFREVQQIFRPGRLDQVAIGAQGVGPADRRQVIGRCQHDDHQQMALENDAGTLEDFEAENVREPQVEHQDAGKGEPQPWELALAMEVIERVLAGIDDVDWVLKVRVFQRALEEENIIFPIFDEQNRFAVRTHDPD